MRRSTELPEPNQDLVASVVVPARDEAANIGACISALGRQSIDPDRFEVLVILSHDDDQTEVALRDAVASHRRLAVHVLHTEGGRGPGFARRMGMDVACERLLSTEKGNGLIATTDADSQVATDWLERQLEAVDSGAGAIGGRIEIEAEARARLGERVLEWRDRAAIKRLDAVSDGEGSKEHWQFSGASIGVTASVYARIDGLEPVAALEDEALERALTRAGIPIHRLDSVRVETSARSVGGSQRGLARDLEVATWFDSNTFSADDFSAESLVRNKQETVSLVLPTRNVASTIGAILDVARSACGLRLLDEVIVVDSNSTDGTSAIALDAGVRVVDESDCMPGFGVSRGKGDALWRSLSVTSGDIVVFVDTDTPNFTPNFIKGLLGPLLTKPELALVKGAFKRPLKVEEVELEDEGGRVTELVARPFINLYFPALAGFLQPLAGEMAARRNLLEELPFPVGYGVEMAMLIDTLDRRGLDAMAQTDLGKRRNRHQPLRSLGAMAYAVLVAGERRVHGEERMNEAVPGPYLLPTSDGPHTRSVPVEERPPLTEVLGKDR